MENKKSKISILPDNIVNKIAAGEVVQRPASVVKELLENSIDAGARKIDLYIARAGKTLIQVVDDGEGMTEKDASICFRRHATSKILQYEDLESIMTYGFRGEALSSIAAVSIFELKTKVEKEELGSIIRIAENSEIEVDKGSFSQGTSISVKNLFYNTPARRNFLKSNSTELKHIFESFNRSALSHPEIKFRLFNEEDVIFDYEAGSLEDRLKSVFADNILDTVIPIKEITEYISLEGYVARPNYLKKSKGEQYLFINKRYVVSKMVNHAVYSAFENILERGDYPFFVIFLTLNPAKVDVNIHPSKLEVKFDDDKDIYSITRAVVKKSIGMVDLVPDLHFSEPDGSKEKLGFTNFDEARIKNYNSRTENENFNFRFKKEKTGVFTDEEIDRLFGSMNPDLRKNAPAEQVDGPFQTPNHKEIFHQYPDTSGSKKEKDSDVSPVFFILQNKYIFSQIKSGLMIIDQHAAHERILYEKALTSFSANLPFAQQLLFAQTVEVDPADYALLQEIEPYLNKLGFEIKFFSKNTVVIDAVPSDIKLGSERVALLEILSEYRKNEREEQLEIRDNLAKSYACKAAIKTGDRIGETETRQLIDQLFATSMPYVCPHGRPIIIKIPLEELDKRFGRI